MALHKIPHRRKQNDPAKHGTIPIHRLRHNRLRRREKAKNEKRKQEAQGDDIDTQAPTAK